MKKKLAKIAALSMAAVSLVFVTVLVTVAFLTSKSGQITNTFTVGDVTIKMDESNLNPDGSKADTRGNGNEYRLVPGKSYIKDPIVYVEAGSETSYVFVEITNGISAIEKNEEGVADTIAEQMAENNWKKISETGATSVYVYAEGEAIATPIERNENEKQELPVFETFSVADEADVSTYGNAQVVLTAYAIQADGFDDESTVVDVWNAVKNAQ